MNLGNLASRAVGEMENKRLQNLYQRDFVAWRADRLGYRSYDWMNQICHETLFGTKKRTAIKSSNGTSKSHEFANMIAWTVDVFDVGEALSIATAPSVPQLETTIFRYMKAAKQRAEQRTPDRPIKGRINESLEWEVKGPEGNIPLVIGRVPASGAEVSRFQGVRAQTGRTYVWGDEAGGLSKNIYTAFEAIITGKDARLGLIGNPDDIGTEWYRLFTEEKYQEDYNLFSISSFQLPTFTNEVVYFDDPEMETRMRSSLTQVEWVDRQKRIWGENDPRYLSKVKGEFPKDGGNGFFPVGTVSEAFNKELEPTETVILGVDLARFGQDECVIAENRGGHIRITKTWSKTPTTESARIIDDYARSVGASEVRVDSSGLGGGIYDPLYEIWDAPYDLIGWDNGSASPDNTRWAQKRTYSYDSLRTQMVEGLIDLDYSDDLLREELQAITFKFNNRGAIQITPKDEIKKEINGRSPDRLDAVILSAVDMSPWTGNPLNNLTPGDKVVLDTSHVQDYMERYDPYYKGSVFF